jgi:secreted trypsin-like serine protease
MAYGYGDYDRQMQPGQKRQVKMSLESIPELKAIKAISAEPNVGICKGDSGGGIFFQSQGQLFMAGVVSGIVNKGGCANASSYAVYVGLYQHLCWLQTETGIAIENLSCSN